MRRVYAFHEKGFNKKGGEEYRDVFMGRKTIEFQSEGVWERNLEELWYVICNGVVCMRLCKRNGERGV